MIFFYLDNKTINEKSPSDEISKKARASPKDRSDIIEQQSKVRINFYILG
jgi:hypothetical protein